MADTWSVTGIKQTTQLSEGQDAFRPGYDVHYQITSGPAQNTRGHVFIPAQDYNDEVVGGTIQRIVEQHQRISNL
jgi:hypothetical protein